MGVMLNFNYRPSIIFCPQLSTLWKSLRGA
jgi:hypothetical protein